MSSFSELKNRIKNNNSLGIEDEEEKTSGTSMSSFQKLKESVTKQQTKSSFQKLKEKGVSVSFDDVGVDEGYINSFFTDATKYFNSAKFEYDRVGWGNASSTYDSRYSTSEDLTSRAKYVRAYINANKSKMSEEQYKSFSKFLDDFEKGTSDVVSSFESAKNFYGQFKTEDDYNTWQKKEDFIKAYIEDSEKAQAELEYDKSWLKEADRRRETNTVLNAEDFDEYSQKGANIVNPTYEEARGWAEIFGWRPGSSPINNKVTFIQDDYNYAAISMGEDGDLVDPKLHFMTDEEVSVYNYYFGKGDIDSANKFLKSLDETLAARQGGSWAEAAKSANLEWIMWIGTGLDQWASGVRNLDNFFTGEEADTTSAMQYAGATVRENIDSDFWRGAWDLGVTVANQLPSILVGSLTGSIGGLATMGASVAGNSYAEMRRLGYDEWQARGYSVLTTASELSLQYVLGGISSLGGKKSLSNIILKGIDGVDNAIGRVALKLGASMLTEGVEEATQSVLEPIFKSIITGEDINIDWGEVAYSGLLGALSAGLLEGGQTIAGDVITTKAGQQVQKAGAIDSLVKLGKESVSNVAKDLAGKVNENTGAYTLGRLLNEVNASLSATNKADIVAALEAKGLRTKDAKTFAKWLNKAVDGEYFSDKQIKILESNEIVSEVFRDVIINQNSTVNQRIKVYNETIETIMKGGNSTASANPTEIQAELGQEAAEDSPSAVETTPTAQISTSDNGKTTLRKTQEEVSVKGIDSIKDGEVFVRLNNDEVVSTRDLDFGSRDAGLVYEAVADMSVDTANEMVQGFNAANSSPDMRQHIPLAEYSRGFREAHRYGTFGYPISEMSSDGFSALLSEEHKQIAYNRGKIDSVSAVNAKQEKIDKVKTEGTVSKKEKVAPKKYKGETHISEVNTKGMTERQKASVSALKTLSDAFGINFYLFESPVVNGKRVGKNGYYDPSDKSIHLDLFAGQNGEQVILFTAAHELTHLIRDISPAKFKTFADFLFEQYGKKGVSVEQLVQAQIKKAKDNGRNITYDTAYEEVVADACETMLADSNAIEKVAKLKAKDKTLWAKIKDFITKLVAKIKQVYAGLKPNSVEAQHVREMVDVAEQLQSLWTDALVDAGETYSAIEKSLSENGIMVDSNTESASLMSVRDLLDSKQQQKVADALATRFGVTVQEAKEWISAETSLASIILNPKYSQYLDYTADPNEEAIKKNSDYPQGTVDFSNICKKRRDFTDVMNRVLRKFPNHIFEATDLAKIRTIMMEEGMEVACGICYVEDRRQLDSVVAQDFINSLALYREGSKTRPDGSPFNTNQLKALKLIEGDTYTPSIYELISLEGRNSLKAKNPAMEEAWVKFNNARGMQSVRLLLNDAEYKRQILKYNEKTVKSKNDHGGLRIYSFSDMEMFHLIDIIQVITDSAAVGLSIQGYTKVNEYAKAVKDTGEKLNRSLIPKGDLGYHMENGRVVLDFDTVEGIDINHPDFFDSTDNPNVGNILIGINPTQIGAAMTSKFIDQIIPFHTGQSGVVLEEKGLAEWIPYNNSQSERDVATGTKSKHQINIYTEVFEAAEKEGKPITNKVEFVNKFLEVCRENNLIPRFSEFLDIDENGNYIYTEGYHKFLVDFKTFDQNTGEYLPQLPVKPIFDNEYLTNLLKQYVKSQKAKDAQLAKSVPTVLERVTKEIIKPDAKYSDREPAKTAEDFVSHMRNIVKGRGAWYASDVIDYIRDNPDLNFIERIFTKDKSVKNDLAAFLGEVEDVKVLEAMSWFIGEAYGDKAPRWGDNGRMIYPFRGAVRTFRNAIKNRVNEIISAKVGGTNLGIKNGEVSLQTVKDLYNRLNSNTDMVEFAEKVFATAERLGVNIRFANQIFDPKAAGDAVGDMVEYKTSFFNDTAISDQGKANIILHELIHTCTVYVMRKNQTQGDVSYSNKSQNYNMISNAATRLNTIFAKIQSDPDFRGQYGLKNAREMVAELSNEKFVGLLKKKNLWERIVDWICSLFGIKRGVTAYENARLCVDYILDNPEISEYKAHAENQRRAARNEGYDVFGSTTTMDGRILYSDRGKAPTFYSQMGKVVEGMKQEKFAANSVVSMLRGRGVKAEEMRWSGIVTWLEGKKSVTKQELLEFIAGSQLQIGEQMSGNAAFIADDGYIYESETAFKNAAYAIADKKGIARDSVRFNIDTKNDMYAYAFVLNTNEVLLQADVEEVDGLTAKWSQYKLDGGSNYREIVFTMPNSSYSNRAMRGHWGEDAEGVLAHARIQDFIVNGKKMLFVEEIQSDWHNEGHSKGYSTKEYEDAVESHDKLYNEYKKLDLAFHKYVRSNEFMTDPEDVRKKKHDWLRGKVETAQKKYLDAEKVVNSLKEKGMGDTPDAPFKDTYHEYVLKRLLRMASEEGYDSIGWTPANIQSKRWSEDYAEGYRIEYDQDIPKFLKKYGKQWGATVGKTNLPNHSEIEKINGNIAELETDLRNLESIMEEGVWGAERDLVVNLLTETKRQLDAAKKGLNGTEVWSMELTDSMKDTVLNEGQVMYSDRYVKAEENSDILAMVEKVKIGDFKSNEKVFLGNVTEQIADEILAETKIDVKGFKVAIEARQIYHILKDHGEHGKSDQSMANPSDIAKMEFAINNHDEISAAGQTQAYKYVVNGKTRGANTILYETRIGEKSYYVVQAVPDTKAKTLYIVTAFIGKSGYKKEASQIINAKSLDVTAKTESTMTSDTMIQQESEIVKTKSKNSQKYSDRDTDNLSNRSLLANALETTAQNDIERTKLKQYKEKIALINSEESKLHELREKIKELSFAKGKRDAEQIRNLQAEATQTANRINTYDRQLLSLESTKALKGVLEREKKLAYKKAEQRGKDALAAYRERTAKTTRELMERYQESRKRGVENRNKTEMRHKIKDVVSELNKLLLHGSKERNIKLGLQEAVRDALTAINMDTVDAEARIAKKQEELMKAKTPEQIEQIQHEIDFIRNMGDNLADKLERMRQAYSEIKSESSEGYSAQFKQEASLIHDRIESVIKEVGNTAIRNMTLQQLQAVYDMYMMVLTTIRLANSIWRDGQLIDLQQNASTVMSELEKLKKLKDVEAASKSKIREFTWNEMTPYYAFERIGSDAFKRYYWDVVEGQNTYAKDVDEAKTFATATREKYGYKKWDLDKVYEFICKDGRTFKTTLKHILSIYAYSKRDQALAHMEKGGFFHNDRATFRKKGGVIELIRRDEVGYKVDADVLAQIKESLTAEQIGYVDEMQEYLTKMGEKGNEVTRVMWGIDIFKEKVYFPLKSKDDFIKKSAETAQAVSLKNDGMTRETVPNASNPIVLEAFDDVWASHVDRMSQYHAFVIPIDNLNKIHQYGTWSGTESMSVSTMMAARFGSEANDYISQFIKDLNGGVVNQGAKNPFASFFTKFKKTAVGASLSTVVQQPTAILRAMAVIDGKYFVGKPNMKTLGTKWAELKKYAPIAIIKEIGGFDAGAGKQAARWINTDALRGKDKVMNAIDDISMKGAEVADKLGWTTIWEAVKREMKAKYPSMDSETFLEKCGERFTEVIVQTQVYDSTLSRSGFMRSKNEGVKMLTAFMGEPTLSINMMFNAIIQAMRGGKGAKAQAVRTIASVYASIIAASAMSSLIYALRDDDEDESYWEKYLQALGGEVLSDVILAPITSLPAIKDIISIFQGWDVERSDVSIFKDIKDAFDGLDSDSKSPYRKIEDFAGAIASVFGLPLKNLLRTGREVYNFFENIFDSIGGGNMGDAFLEGFTGDEKTKAEKLYEAIINGDEARLEVYKRQYKDNDALLSALRGEIKSRYLTGELNSNTALEQLIDYGDMDKYDAYWKMKEWDYEMANGTSEGYSKYNNFYTAVETGKNLKAVIKEYTEHGVKAQTLASQITSHFKPLYKEMTNYERARIKGYLLNAYVQLGYDRADKSKDIDKWLED